DLRFLPLRVNDASGERGGAEGHGGGLEKVTTTQLDRARYFHGTLPRLFVSPDRATLGCLSSGRGEGGSIALEELGRHPRGAPGREHEADVLGRRAQQGLARRRSYHLKPPRAAHFAVVVHDPGAD